MINRKENRMKDVSYGNNIIRIQKTIYKDKTYIDIRKYYKDEETDEFKPTRKGITIPFDIAEDILKTGIDIINT